MKKSIIALAVAGALTAPMIAQADATLYGTAQYRGVAADDTTFQNKMAKTRLGVKGTVDNDVEGLTTGFQFEWEFAGNGQGSTNSADVAVRKSNVYMKGGFGQVTFGRQNNPANTADAMTDILGNDSAWEHQNADRIGQGLAYVSPSLGGVNLHAGFIADGAAETVGGANEDLDATILGVTYSGMGIGAAVLFTTSTDNADVDTEITSVGVNYSGIENVYLAANYSTTEVDGQTAEPEIMNVAASYTMGKTTLAAIYADYDADDGTTEGSQVIVGVRYALGAKASVGVDYADYDSDAEADGNKDTLVLEYTLSF